jgi:hypothetical protein
MINRWKKMKLQKLNKKIKNNWKKLSDEEVSLYHDTPDAFFDIIKQKYSMFRNDAERRIAQLK